MAVSIITKEDLQEFKTELIEEIKSLFHIKTTEQSCGFALQSQSTSENFLRTLQNLRINGTLRYSKVGGTIYYNYQDIEKLFNEK